MSLGKKRPRDASAAPCQALFTHPSAVTKIALLPHTHLIATACRDGHLRAFARDGRGTPIREIHAHADESVFTLAPLGRNVVVSGGSRHGGHHPRVATWAVGPLLDSTGPLLDSLNLPQYCGSVSAVSGTGGAVFVVGTVKGYIFFISHASGRKLRVLSQRRNSVDAIQDICRDGKFAVVAGREVGPSVWSMADCERVAILRGHSRLVSTVAINALFVVTGSHDKSIGVFRNGGGFELVRSLKKPLLGEIEHVALAGDTLISTSKTDRDEVCLNFFSLSSYSSLGHVNVAIIKALAIDVTCDGRIAIGGKEKSVIASPPVSVTRALKAHIASELGPFTAASTPDGVSVPPMNSGVGTEAPRLSSGNSSVAVKKEPAAVETIDLLLDSSDLRALKSASSDLPALQSMSVAGLTSVVAASMINFEDEFLGYVSILAGCLLNVFRNNGISGDTIVCFPRAKLWNTIVDGLKSENKYAKLPTSATENFEWRLNRFLLELRAKK